MFLYKFNLKYKILYYFYYNIQKIKTKKNKIINSQYH